MTWQDYALIVLLALAVVNVAWAWPRTKLAKKKLEKWEDR